MQGRLETFLKAIMIGCAILVVWSVWVSAQGTVPGPEVEFSETRYEVAENAGSATVVVRRKGDTNATVSVELVNIGGTAARNDYNLSVGAISFPPGKTEEKVPVTITDNTEPQGTRTIKLALSNPAGARLGSRTTSE